MISLKRPPITQFEQSSLTFVDHPLFVKTRHRIIEFLKTFFFIYLFKQFCIDKFIQFHKWTKFYFHEVSFNRENNFVLSFTVTSVANSPDWMRFEHSAWLKLQSKDTSTQNTSFILSLDILSAIIIIIQMEITVKSSGNLDTRISWC